MRNPVNLKQEEREINRLKGILFPTKGRSRLSTEQYDQSQQNEFETKAKGQNILDSIGYQHMALNVHMDVKELISLNEDSNPIRDEINRLRCDIDKMLEKQSRDQQYGNESERIFLQRMNHMSDKLGNYSSDLKQAFKNFIDSLPLSKNPKQHYANQYYFQMILNNTIASKIQNIFAKNIRIAFGKLLSNSVNQKQMQNNQLIDRKQKINYLQKMNLITKQRSFARWRLNCQLEHLKEQTGDIMQSNNLDILKKIMRHVLNEPYMILLLEEYALEQANHCQILLLNQNTKKLYKYIENSSINTPLNSALQTITQRSLLLANDIDIKSISRFQFNLDEGLTKICISRGEILFVQNMSKNSDFSFSDNHCAHQISHKNKNAKEKSYSLGGCILYPILNGNNECLAVVRQYFYDYYERNQQKIRPISLKKLREIGIFIEYTTKMNDKLRQMSQEKENVKNNYYLQFIQMIKHLEKTDHKDFYLQMTVSFQKIFPISALNIYQVIERKQKADFSKNKSYQLILKSSDACNRSQTSEDNIFLLTALDFLCKQRQNEVYHIYIQDRLVIYVHSILYDFALTKTSNQGNKNSVWIGKNDKSINQKLSEKIKIQKSQSMVQVIEEEQVLPVKLIYKLLTKLQQMIAVKKRQNQYRAIIEQIEYDKKNQTKKQKLAQDFDKLNESLFQTIYKNCSIDDVLTNLKQYMNKLMIGINEFKKNSQNQNFVGDFYLLIDLKNKRMSKSRIILMLDQPVREVNEEDEINQFQLARKQSYQIRLTPLFTIYIPSCEMIADEPTLFELTSSIKEYIESFLMMSMERLIEKNLKQRLELGQIDDLRLAARDQNTKRSRFIEQNFFNLTQDDSSARIKEDYQRNCLQFQSQLLSDIITYFQAIVNHEISKCGFISSRKGQIFQILNKQTLFQKQLIIRFASLTSNDVKAEIINLHPILDMNSYIAAQMIAHGNFQNLFDQNFGHQLFGETFLILYSSQDYNCLRRVKNVDKMKEKGVNIKIGFYINEMCQGLSYSIIIEQMKQMIKRKWVDLCRLFMDSKRALKQNFIDLSTGCLMDRLNVITKRRLIVSFQKIKQMDLIQNKSSIRFLSLMATINHYHQRNICRSFLTLKGHNHRAIMMKLATYQNYQNISSFATKLSIILFKGFKSIKLIHHTISNNLCLLVAVFKKVMNKDQIRMLHVTFSKIYYFSNHVNSSIYALQGTIEEIILKTKMNSFKMIKCNQQRKLDQSSVIADSDNWLEEETNLFRLTSKFRLHHPNHYLYLKINSEECFSFVPYENNKKVYNIVQVSALKNKHSLLHRYDIIFRNIEIIWFYQPQHQNQFTLKDFFNTTSKKILDIFKNWQRIATPQFTKINFIHREFLKKVKIINFRNWRRNVGEARRVERYEQNDTIYQVAIEMQTMKQKIKSQEKIIKSNANLFVELTEKNRFLKESIDFYSHSIHQIEQCDKQLDIKRGVERSLERRELLKVFFIIWRENNLQIKDNILQAKENARKSISKGIKVLCKSLEKINKRNIGIYFKNVMVHSMFQKIEREKMPRQKVVEDLNIKVYLKEQKEETKECPRLMTFYYEQNQNQLNKENSSFNSNNEDEQSLGELDSNRYFIRSNRSKLQESQFSKQNVEVTEDQAKRMNSGQYKLNPKTLRFLKRMGKLEQKHLTNKFFN